jgi:hypothetical protein
MKKQNNLYSGISDPGLVDAYMSELEHPMADVISYIRSFILKTDKLIGEGIYWNAPTFFYTGPMAQFTPKDYKRYIVGFVLNRNDCVRMIFLTGAKVDDGSGLLEGDFKDGRRLVVFKSLADVKAKEKELKKVIKKWISLVE